MFFLRVLKIGITTRVVRNRSAVILKIVWYLFYTWIHAIMICGVCGIYHIYNIQYSFYYMHFLNTGSPTQVRNSTFYIPLCSSSYFAQAVQNLVHNKLSACWKFIELLYLLVNVSNFFRRERGACIYVHVL